MWIGYAYCKFHLARVLQFLPTNLKLAEWIGENMQNELGFPDTQDPAKWSVSELTDILHKYVVAERNCCSLHTFGCLEWESELCRGVMCACCHSFNMPKHWFHNMNPQVYHNLLYHSYPIDIPHSSRYTSWLSMVIPDICSVCRILCSQCPHIHLSWTVTTHRPTDVPLEECWSARPQLY